ncbi:clathrin interactor EPSIN 1-like isoform X1 [Lycium barbarum]|uniref:clathrin interactor EPSIN 1-like isoform X1 n=1 Tax=Lycium barbarum TaxID=112863 RepID=UPI00293EF103|nr:clathrin interactor EPSIN 1-like isoform X1 [Lycium barbarum]XP_060169419.1 clathrin interactor EPSIN 1-like isoform X1 [Lycium barbarum]
MDFMKVFDQTVREIKREVNLKVLKVPEIEQKVLDATDDEPWGPHGTALAEIAQATKKFSECQMVMNVLWTRLPETGKNWRYVYKSLAVIEYLVAHGSERAVDEIVEHTYQISSLTSFEYVEPNGKDMGINVRKKAENVVALLNNKEKIQEVRDKAAANRDKYFGLSSSGVTFKSNSTSFSSSSNFQGGDRYGGFGNKSDGDSFKDNYKEKDRYGEDKIGQSTFKSKKGSSHYGSKVQDTVSAGGSKTAKKIGKLDKASSNPSRGAAASSSKYEEDFDDFDPRGTSSTKPSTGNSEQVDLFGQNLIGDLLDAPTPVPADNSTVTNHPSEVDLFADANFVSAKPQSEISVDLFASQSSSSPAASSTMDFFAAPDPVIQPDVRSSKSVQMNTTTVDPFAAVPLNNFGSSDPFGAFVTHADPVSVTNENAISGGNQEAPTKLDKSPLEAKPSPKKDNFQVRSGIWADSLSRGLIDLNIAAPTKVNLADVGIMGGLTDGSDVKDKGPTTFYMGNMGRAMGQGTKLGQSGSTSTATGVDDLFSSHQNYQFGSFQK